MKTFLLTGAALAVVFALLIAGWQYALYRQANSPEGLAIAARDAAALAAWKVADARLDVLARDGCAKPVAAILKLSTETTLLVRSDIPEQLASDISFCLERGLIRGYAKGQLAQANVLKFFQS